MNIFSFRSSNFSQSLNQEVCFKKLVFLGIFIFALFLGGKLIASCYFHCASHHNHIEKSNH